MTKTNPKVLGYKIRRKSDDQYMKKGGQAFKNAFSPRGSIFSQRSHAVASLKMKLTKETMDLALEVYNVSKTKYQEGVGSSTELMDADNAYKQAQSNYYNALLEALLAKVDYDKALGILIEQ